MEAFLPVLGAIEATGIAQFLRASRWGYAFVNGAHILGIALLIGAIVPLQLRFLGLWQTVGRVALARVLVPVAAGGLALAVTAGGLLFAVRAREDASSWLSYRVIGLMILSLLSALGASY